MNLDVTLQIFSGGYTGKPASYDAVERKLASVLPRLPVRRVIMGWSTDKILYEKTAAFLAKHNVEFYLWFPVFSETGLLKTLNPLIDIWEKKVEFAAGHNDENFSFCCPNDSQNIEKILDIFESHFAAIPFNGIFLDKIRYPSFANGAGPGYGSSCVFSCFCPQCLELYKKEGIDINVLKNAITHQFTAPLGITKYNGNGKYDFEDVTLAKFFKIKSGIITKQLEQICQYFREKGYGTGLDVFAPFMSPFVGQDLTELAKLCDFMKPMMYRHTQAPAGLPFETRALLEETGSLLQANEMNGQQFKKYASGDAGKFCELLDLEIGKTPFDLDFTIRELTGLASSTSCPIYAGMEINRKEKLAEVYPDYIEETIKAYAQTGIKGLALSWDLLDAPEENIAKTAEVIESL